MSGWIGRWSNPQRRPVRPNPVITSSATSKMSFLRQVSATVSQYSSVAMRQAPAAPVIGSNRKAAIVVGSSRSIVVTTASASSHGTFGMSSRSGS